MSVGQPFWGVINNPGFPVNLNDIKAQATGMVHGYLCNVLFEVFSE